MRSAPHRLRYQDPRILALIRDELASSRFELASAGQIHRSRFVRKKRAIPRRKSWSDFRLRKQANHVRAFGPEKAESACAFSFRWVREPSIFPYMNLSRRQFGEASASYEQTDRIELFRDGSTTRRISSLLLFVAPKKRRRSAPRRTAKRADARRVARDLIGLPETSVGSSRARAPEARLGLRAPRAIRKAAPEKFVPGDKRYGEQLLRRARIGSRGSRRARYSQSATRGAIRSSRIKRGPICPRRTSFDSVSFGRRPANARITGVRFFSRV